MSRLWLGRSEASHQGCEWRYRIAGLGLSCRRPLPVLDAFALAGAGPEDRDPPPLGLLDGGAVSTTGLIGGRPRRVEAVYDAGCCTLGVEGLGPFHIDQRRIRLPGANPGPPSQALIETLTGPVLLLALAERGRFALHAGAALIAGAGLWVFLGDSGAGKSTLAGYASRVPGCRPVADDLLPFCWEAGRPWALPWYPQLKLGLQGQYGGGSLPERLPVAGIAVLEPVASGAEVRALPLSGLGSISALTRQSVPARLYAPPMLARHFQELARVAGALPLYRLEVPRELGRLGEVYGLLSGLGPGRGGSSGT